MDVKKPDRTVLKSYFVKNAVPTESNFADLIDGMLNQKEDGITKPPGEPVSLQADGNDTSQKKAINFYMNFADAKPAWTLSLNPRRNPASPKTASPGWSIGDAEGNSKLFIDQTTGNLGVGTISPSETLEVNGRAKSGPMTIGPWPANGAYAFVGTNLLDQALPGNYALLQGATAELGRTYLNSPLDIRLRISNTDRVIVANNGDVGVGTTTPAGKLHVQTGGAGAWDRLVVKSTNHWGDGDTQYVTIGEGGAAGIMFYNPHVVWYAPEARASIRMGRSGGVANGHWWDVGVRAGNQFTILDGQNGVIGLSITEAGQVKVNVLQLGEKFRLSGVGDFGANDKWLRLTNPANTAYSGGFAAFELWANQGLVQGSDLRLKRDVMPLPQDSQDILKLRGVRFTWRDGAERASHGIGLIAQEVEEVFPEVVRTGPDGMKGVNYAVLIAPLIEAIKRQQAEINELRADVQALPEELMADAVDFWSLRQEGLALIQRFAGESWTDHNTHDPGITILEQVCYALTDLAYRAEHEWPDLLATGNGGDPYASLYTPAAILPSGPVTVTDLRKLVIDVPGVKNAWIEIVDEVSASYDAAQAEVAVASGGDGAAAANRSPNVSEIRPRGLYRVRIEKSDLMDIDGAEIRRQAARRLHRFRGLGDDYAAIDVLEYQDVRIDATLEIALVGDATDLLASVFASVATYCSPSVPFHTLGEMLDRGRRVDEIFEGPLLDHGFIDSRELAGIVRPTSLRISDLIHALTAVPGVVAVKNLHFVSANGEPSREWLLSLDPARAARFDLANSTIRLERRSLQVDSEALRGSAHHLFVARANRAAGPLQSAAAERDVRPVSGRDRKIGRYYSIQQQFPMVYGIGAAGLSQTASSERQAQAKQLKAYLMFFDQLLANYFAQLANAARLFSFDDDTPDSYFSQPVQDDADGTLGLDRIRNSGPAHEAVLRRITEDPWDQAGTGVQPGLGRRNRLLDHLLARIGEQFTDYSLLQFGLIGQDALPHGDQLARDKRAYLRDYPRIGRDRGVAFNYLAAAPAGSSEFLPGDCMDPAGLVMKLTAASPDPWSAFLWAQSQPEERRVLSSSNADRKEMAAVLTRLFNRVIHSGASLYDVDRFALVSLSDETRGLLQQSVQLDGDDLVRLNRLLLEDAYPAAIARSRDDDNLSGLELTLRRKLGIRDRDERFHLVEHVLLRPVAGDAYQHGPLFRAARTRDPYSLQISLVFPSWPARYQDQRFQQFVEAMVREQTPAHLTAYVIWLDRPAMQAFEAAHAVWLHHWRNQRIADLGL